MIRLNVDIATIILPMASKNKTQDDTTEPETSVELGSRSQDQATVVNTMNDVHGAGAGDVHGAGDDSDDSSGDSTGGTSLSSLSPSEKDKNKLSAVDKARAKLDKLENQNKPDPTEVELAKCNIKFLLLKEQMLLLKDQMLFLRKQSNKEKLKRKRDREAETQEKRQRKCEALEFKLQQMKRTLENTK